MAAGWELHGAGHDVTILEAQLHPGGRVHTIREGLPDDLYAEAGAQLFYNVSPSEVSCMEARLDSLLRQYESGGITRRDLVASLVFLVASCAAASDLDSLYRATELNHVTIRVTDLKRSKEFYQHLLDLPVIQEDDQICYLKSGTGFLCLVQTEKETPPGFDHLCFGIGGFDRTVGMAKLSTTGLPLRHDPGDPDTVYVLDPDNNSVQLEPAGYAG